MTCQSFAFDDVFGCVVMTGLAQRVKIHMEMARRKNERQRRESVIFGEPDRAFMVFILHQNRPHVRKGSTVLPLWARIYARTPCVSAVGALAGQNRLPGAALRFSLVRAIPPEIWMTLRLRTG